MANILSVPVTGVLEFVDRKDNFVAAMPRKNMRCVVKGCTSVTGVDVKEKRMFCFPRQKDLCQKWVDFCQNPYVDDKFRSGSLSSMAHIRICSLHFAREKFCHELKTKLLRGAFPEILNAANIGSADDNADHDTIGEVESVREVKIEPPFCDFLGTEISEGSAEISEGSAAEILAPVCSKHFPIVDSCEQCKAAMMSGSSSQHEESVNVNMQACRASSLTLDAEADRTSLQNTIVQELESVLCFQWLEEKSPPHWKDLKKSIIEVSVERAIHQWCQEKIRK
ncbi:hypothetical protein J437_LFUL009674 [Ladona fulva]|uniref:THAP-type domain-containing protein n=1 Tax=Ladona fulva TaxID=123851 RepID=A0A8K0K5I7_LADFU|nr:hypothetical protein J437_LFUL009674 [Ladona fulva]